MGIRKHKRRVYRLLRARLEHRKRWYNPEDIEWLNMPPVGHEFGSPDYERLTQESQAQGRRD